MAKLKRVQLFQRFKIRDTLAHPSDWCEWKEEPALTIWLSNTHDQDLTIQVYGNQVGSRLGAIPVGASFTLALDLKKVEP